MLGLAGLGSSCLRYVFSFLPVFRFASLFSVSPRFAFGVFCSALAAVAARAPRSLPSASVATAFFSPASPATFSGPTGP
eukprot:5644352-Pyramimonas_sp.AAC.1